LAIPPSHAGNDLRMTGIQYFWAGGFAARGFRNHDFANGTAVAIFLAPFDGYVTPKYQLREVLF